MDWKQPTHPLTLGEIQIDWQFDPNSGQPRVVSNALIERSTYTAQLLDQYQISCEQFLKQQTKIREVMSLGKRQVEKRKAQVVAVNMLDIKGKQIQRMKDVQIEIADNLELLQRMETERLFLEKVKMDQLELIHKLTSA